jgi:hypothetical protein
MGATRQNLQARPKILKKLSEHQINTKKFPKIVYLVTYKRKGAKNLCGSYPTKYAGSTQNPKKNYRNIKPTVQNENFLKKKKYV